MALAGGNLRAAATGLLGMAVFASHDALIKAVGGRMGALQVLFFVSLFSVPFVTLAFARDRSGDGLAPKHPLPVALRSIAMVLGLACGMYAFATLPLTQTYALLFTMPLWVTVLAVPLLGEKVGWQRLLAIVVGLAGVLIVLRPGQTDLALGHAAALVGAFCSAFTGTMARRIGKGERTAVLLFWPAIGSLALGALSLPWVYTPPALGDLSLLAVIAALSLLANAILVAAYRVGEAAIVAPMQYSQMIWAVIFGWAFFREPSPDTIGWIGIAIIVAAGLFIVVREQKGPSQLRPVSETRIRPSALSGPR